MHLFLTLERKNMLLCLKNFVDDAILKNTGTPVLCTRAVSKFEYLLHDEFL